MLLFKFLVKAALWRSLARPARISGPHRERGPFCWLAEPSHSRGFAAGVPFAMFWPAKSSLGLIYICRDQR